MSPAPTTKRFRKSGVPLFPSQRAKPFGTLPVLPYHNIIIPCTNASIPVKFAPLIAGKAPVSFDAVNAAIAESGISVKFAPDPLKLDPVISPLIN